MRERPNQRPGEKLESALGICDARQDLPDHRPEDHAAQDTAYALPLGAYRTPDTAGADHSLITAFEQWHDKIERFNGRSKVSVHIADKAGLEVTIPDTPPTLCPARRNR